MLSCNGEKQRRIIIEDVIHYTRRAAIVLARRKRRDVVVISGIAGESRLQGETVITHLAKIAGVSAFRLQYHGSRTDSAALLYSTPAFSKDVDRGQTWRTVWRTSWADWCYPPFPKGFLKEKKHIENVIYLTQASRL